MLIMKRITIKIIYVALLIFTIWRCHSYVFFAKRNPLKTHILASGIFEERFESFRGGVLMSNTVNYYLTDSITFRKYIGACDEDEIFKSSIDNDRVVIVKFSWKNWYMSKREMPIDTLYFSIGKLKEEGVFE